MVLLFRIVYTTLLVLLPAATGARIVSPNLIGHSMLLAKGCSVATNPPQGFLHEFDHIFVTQPLWRFISIAASFIDLSGRHPLEDRLLFQLIEYSFQIILMVHRPTGGRSPPRHPGGREAAGRTVRLHPRGGCGLEPSPRDTPKARMSADFERR